MSFLFDFTNHFSFSIILNVIGSDWILLTGFWNDIGIWNDSENWID